MLILKFSMENININKFHDELNRITSYNVCYTKLLRGKVDEEDAEVLLDVLGAKRRQEIKYIDEV